MVDETRLFDSVEVSYRKLRPYREAVYRLNEEYAGPMYGLEGNTSATAVKQEKYLNLLKQAVTAYMTLLASNRPRVLLTATDPALKPFSRHFQLAVNNLIKEIQLEKTMSRWVRDAFFWLGVTKVHMGDSGEVIEEGDVTADPGRPFVSNISLDDFFYDMSATKWSECKYAGDVYRMPIETLQNSGAYSGEALENLQPSTKFSTGERLSELSKGTEPRDMEIEPMVDVCDIWLPREGKIKTYVVESRHNMRLRSGCIAEMKWDGRELGPYHLLHFDEVSENVMPCSTAADIEPLERLINNLYRKNARKASRQKDTPIYSPSGENTARKLKNASDGEWISVTDPRDVNVIKHGGIDGQLHGFMLNSMELFDRMAGNLQQMLGLGASTDTVGQEKLVASAGSRKEGQLQNAVASATSGVVRDLAMLLWEDEFTELPARVNLEGMESITYDSTWKPDLREGKFKDYSFDIDIYSMQYQSPGSRIQAINQLLQSIYIPMMPVMQQQGGSVDMAALAEMHSELLNVPRLKDVVLFNSYEPVPSSADQMRTPTNTNRTYTRKDAPSDQSSGVPDASQWMNQQGNNQ